MLRSWVWSTLLSFTIITILNESNLQEIEFLDMNNNRAIAPPSKLERRGTSSSSNSSWSEKFHLPSLTTLRTRVSANSGDLSARTKFFRSRSKSPAPETIRKSTTADMRRSPSPEATSYLENTRRVVSPTPVSPYGRSPASPQRSRAEKRNSYGSRKSSNDYRRYSGTINHYGRHSNDWLFGGFSLRDTVRDGVERLLHNDDKES